MKAIKGKGFLEPVPLKIELEEVQKRLRTMNKALDRETQEDSIKRIKQSIKAHEREEARLKELIKVQ